MEFIQITHLIIGKFSVNDAINYITQFVVKMVGL
nr:MAG TPA: hypothetical protein [Herelleviridae sp.]